jgi:hypothetical protein
LVIVPPD